MLTLRAATYADGDLLYRWRVEDERAADWYEGSPVAEDAHRAWFRRRIHDPLVQLWVACDGDTPVGQVRVDSNGEVSYSVTRDFQRLGYATAMLQQTKAATDHDRLKASVDRGNEAGVRTLLAAGFDHRPDVDFYLCRL